MFPLKNEGNKYFSNFSKILFTIIILQIIYGAFVAGLDAGKFMNNWPKMTEKWIDVLYIINITLVLSASISL